LSRFHRRKLIPFWVGMKRIPFSPVLARTRGRGHGGTSESIPFSPERHCVSGLGFSKVAG
jgi:hypothetical protein